MASVASGGRTGTIYIDPVGTHPPYTVNEINNRANLRNFTTSFSGTFSTGGNKLANVNVSDLFEVYPELVEAYYSAGFVEDDEKRQYENEFAKNLLVAAEYIRGKKALKSLPKIKSNKEEN